MIWVEDYGFWYNVFYYAPFLVGGLYYLVSLTWHGILRFPRNSMHDPVPMRIWFGVAAFFALCAAGGFPTQLLDLPMFFLWCVGMFFVHEDYAIV